MNFISCHIQNSLLLCSGSESGKRNSLSSFGSWSEWAQEWLEIHSSAIRLRWHKLAARMLPDTDRFAWIGHCRGSADGSVRGGGGQACVEQNTGRRLRSLFNVFWNAEMLATFRTMKRNSKTNLNMGDLEGHGRKNAESWDHGATQPRWPAEALQDHSRQDPSGHGRDADQSGSYQSLGWRNVMLRPENPSNSPNHQEHYESKGSS